MKQTTFTKLVMAMTLASVALTGCNKFTKSENKSPAKLVALTNQTANLTPILTAKLDKSRQGKGVSDKDVLALEIGVGADRFVAADRTGVVQGFVGGQSAWKIELGEPIMSGVGYDESSNTAIVSTRSGKVVALDGESGATRWTTDIKATVLAPAVIAGNRVLLSANNGVLYGLNLQSGAMIWQFSTATPNVSVRGTAKPLRLDGNTALFGTADGRIHALASDTGSPLWTRRVGVAIGGSDVGRMSDVDGTPLVVGQYLFVTSFSGNFSGFDMATGQTLFSERNFATTRPVAYMGGTLIGVDTTGAVVGFDPMTGTKLWENNELRYRKLSEPVAVGEFVAVGDYEGVVHLLNDKGVIVGRANTKGKGQITSLTANDDRLYAQTADGIVAVWQVR